jgi:hypothetical protein
LSTATLEVIMGFRRSDFPAKVFDFPLGQINLSETELALRFGPGVVPEPEPFTYPGPVLLWSLEAEDGQCIVLEHHLSQKSMTVLCAEPMNLKLALQSLGIAQERVTWAQTQAEITKFELATQASNNSSH